MTFAWKAAGVTYENNYVKYAETCAQAVRNVLKEELQVAAQRRSENGLKFQTWKEGKPSDSKYIVQPKEEVL